jgi:diguanylate cyclase (GGDEF)-like protein
VKDANATTRVPSSFRPRADNDPAPPEACLVLIHGGELGKRYALQGAMSVGREADNDIVVDRTDVSRHHAALLARAGAWTIVDLGSTNGTLVNDEATDGERVLENGDIVRVGGAILKYLVGNDAEAQFFDEIYRLTIYDGLTRVHNRRYLDEFLEREISRAARHGRPLALALLDIDHFKLLNDEHGHLVGDDVLRELALRVSRRVRKEELLARYGGEEFAIVIPEMGLEKARLFCQRVCQEIGEEPFEMQGLRLTVTLSIGVAALEPDETRTQLVNGADEALYRAKDAGRNRVEARPPRESSGA